MKYTVALGFFFGLAAAQSATTSAASSGSTDLPGLVSQLPTCAVSCLNSAAKTIGCSATDFSCLCTNQERLISTLTPCVLTAGCSTDDIATAARIAPEICENVQNNPNPSAIASASNLVTGALGTATGSTAATATSQPNAAGRREYSLGMVGAAAFAAAMI
ncbi:uncharacterized protein CTRU02_209168 [Colletotrichum truncatum]|uniref:Uncharacterized protein n=1 Tax=Colletotrichum truncatum TaxID=5467 RepID=A0ACC3YYQ2_COLTU|nr:uncharacterized protein CTRU02_14525 [Colletotrichum truncatum]KAF6782081.1 hypothetical protein CTRU02_14525 [Colletotrichum truncatum]